MSSPGIADKLSAAVQKQRVASVELRRVVPVPVGPRGAEAAQVAVHRFVGKPPVFYAWRDPSAEGTQDQLVIVRGGPNVRSAKEAVGVAVAHMAGVDPAD